MEKRKFILTFVLIVLFAFLCITFVNAEGEITTVKYRQVESYITKIKADTTVESFLSNLISNNNETCKVYEGSKELTATDTIKTGNQLKVGENTIYTLVVRGDINCDGKISATDLSKLKQHIVNVEVLTGASLKAADINYNDNVTVLDLSQLKMLLVGMDVPEPEVSTGNIVVTQDPTGAAKEVNLTVGVKDGATIDYNKIKYSLDGGNTYNTYEKAFKVDKNLEVKIKLIKEYVYEMYSDINIPESEYKTDPTTGEKYLERTGENEKYFQQEDESYDAYMNRLMQIGAVEKETVTEETIIEESNYILNNIDTKVPEAFSFTSESLSDKIIVSAETTDTYEDYKGNIASDGIAGVKKYEYKLNDGNWQDSNEFINLVKNTDYTVSVRAIDHAGNITNATNNGEVVKTKSIDIENASITFNYSNSQITNEDVEVTMNCEGLEGTNLQIQYQVNGVNGNWINGNKYVAQGNCIIYARIADTSNQEGNGAYATANILNIDKLAPNTVTIDKKEQTNTNVKIQVSATDADATETSCKSGIASYIYYILDDKGEVLINKEETSNEYNFTGLDIENHGYIIYVTAKDLAGNATVSDNLIIGQVPNTGLGIGVINPGPENVTVNGLKNGYKNPVIPVGFKAVNTTDASWEGTMPSGWNNGLVIEDKEGNQFVWVPVDGTAVKYQKGIFVWDYGDSDEWSKLNGQIKGDEIPLSLQDLETENAQIQKYEGFYVSRYEAGNDAGMLGSKEGLQVVNGVEYSQAKTYAESMYRLVKVKSGLLTGTMWDTMTKWIANEKGQEYVTNNKDTGNTYETAFTFSGTYATGPNTVTEMRSAYKNGINVNKESKTRMLLTTGIVNQFKAKNIYDTAGNVWEYTSEYLINEENSKQYIARGGNYYWQYDTIVSSGTAVREYVSELEGEVRNEGGFRVALYLTEGAAEIGVFEDFNRTINGQEASYDNPVIPAGFAAVNKGGLWGNGRTQAPEWNSGLVIEDKEGNEFVWVPVDGTTVSYAKWTRTGISFEETGSSEIPNVVNTWGETEQTQVEKYGGFYIARYEASLSETEKVQSKPDQDVILGKRYNEIKPLSETMETKEKVAVGLVTGMQWDTVMKWIANELGTTAVTDDSTTWGTYGENISRTGANSVKNIYDLAGNAWEFTSEKFGENERVYRGGVHLDSTVPAAYRGAKGTNLMDNATGFRLSLYVTGPIEGKTSPISVQPDLELKGTNGTPPIPDANGNVTIVPSTISWTNQDVNIEINNTNKNYTVEYQINSTNGKWIREKTYTATENCTIYARLANSKGQGGVTTKYVVDNIDKIAPNEFTPTITSKRYNQIVLLANVSDNLSGVGTYKYYLNGMNVATTSTNTYTISGLTEETTYSIYVEVWDNAGNYRKSTAISATTTQKNIANVVTAGQYVSYTGFDCGSWRVLSIENGCVNLLADYLSRVITFDELPYGHIMPGENGWGYDLIENEPRMRSFQYALGLARISAIYGSNLTQSTRSVNDTDFKEMQRLGLVGASYYAGYRYSSPYNNRYWLGTSYKYVDMWGNIKSFDISKYYSTYDIENGKWQNAPGITGFVRPVITLKADVYPIGGDGSAANPWQLGI